MSSNYEEAFVSGEVVKTVKCNVCHGSGLVLVHGQETDCTECEGWGDFEVPA